jgi:predicted dehydrogenase
LLQSDLGGKTETFSFAALDKERAELEDFAHAVARGVNFVIAPEEIVNGVAATEAIAASARTRQAVSVAP